MARNRSTKRNRRSVDARVRRRGVLGLGTGAGAAVVFGMAALSAPPPAHADDFGLADLMGDLLGGAVATTAGADQAAGIVADGVGLAAADTVTASTGDWFQDFIYLPIHTGLDAWLSSDFGREISEFTNQISGQFLIGDGADGTAAHPDGGNGGLWFGDGGNGWDSTEAGAAGGAGGDARGFFGNGGDGGEGGAGAHGGDGGDGGTIFGFGGDGGAGGVGDTASGLPALGGAGGNAGMLGQHGDVGAAALPPGGLPSGNDGGLSTTGRWFTDSDGRVVNLHGLNEVIIIGQDTPAESGFGDDDAAFLAANGFNVVRLGVDWSQLEPEPGVFNQDYLASIEQTVQTLANHNIVSVLDMHQQLGAEWTSDTGGLPSSGLPFPLNLFFDPAHNHALDAFWGNASAPDGVGLENHYALMMQLLADRFKDNPAVLGYEIMNEPLPGSQTLPTIFGSSHFEAQQLTPFYDQVAAAIRSVDPTTPIFYEPQMLATAGLPIQLGGVDTSNTVLSFHDYCYVDLGPLGCLPDVSGVLNNAVSYADSHDIPAFMSEFGSTSNQSWLDAMLRPADQQMVSWTEWVYGGPQQSGVGLDGSPASLVNDPAQPPVGDNVNEGNLLALTRPYPQLVAGTPTSWSFDNGAFQFSYSTDRADGTGAFAAGSQTTISVPTVQFPAGYHVTVTGGEVVSAPNAPVLIIASDSGATTVTVSVSAAPSA